MTIRKATAHDIPVLQKLFHLLNESYDHSETNIHLALTDKHTSVLVLEEDNIVVATGTITFRTIPTAGRIGYIDDVVADSNYRGRGFGRAISEACIAEARIQHCVRIELTSRPARIAANKLYQSLGFTLRETNSYVMHLL